ncbi:hypothetical protein GALMADRAFT_23199, partial [Galerina marginata CBS 339.88]
KEIGINKPTPFDGSRTKVKSFLQECALYLSINGNIYNSEPKKIAFILSYMTEKEAKQWREQFLSSITDKDGMITFPAQSEFREKLLRAFSPIDQTRDAMNKLELLRQGNKTAEELVTEFRLLVGQAGLGNQSTSDNLHLIQMFRKALKPQIANKILFSDKVPTTFEDWVDRATQYNANYRMAMAFMGRPTAHPNGGRNWNSSAPRTQRDPNAMQIDAMSPEVRADHIRRGACFNCHKHGHLSRDCP